MVTLVTLSYVFEHVLFTSVHSVCYLVLLDANPLDNINDTKKIAGVCFNGRWLNKSAIDAMLADLSKRNTAAKNKYDWSKRGEY